MVELGEKQYESNFEFGKLSAKCADFIILVNKEQTKPIQDALEQEKYPKEKVFVFETFNEAIQKARELNAESKEKYILIENDLPDNYKK